MTAGTAHRSRQARADDRLPGLGGTIVECNRCQQLQPGGVDVSLPRGFKPTGVQPGAFQR